MHFGGHCGEVKITVNTRTVRWDEKKQLLLRGGYCRGVAVSGGCTVGKYISGNNLLFHLVF